MQIENLRSPHAKTHGLCYFPRMIDKIRLHNAGTLPADYVKNLGTGFDGRCVSFLKVEYAAIVERAAKGGSDEDLLDWCHTNGRKPTDEEIEVWNGFMSKRGWKDDAAEILQRRKRENGIENRTDIETMFDYIDIDEGRDPKAV